MRMEVSNTWTSASMSKRRLDLIQPTPCSTSASSPISHNVSIASTMDRPSPGPSLIRNSSCPPDTGLIWSWPKARST